MAGLPWIQVATNLPGHPKSIRLGRKLNDPRAWTYMVQAWLWCAAHLPSGRFEGADAGDLIEHAAGWTGEPGALYAAAVEVGFLDRDEGATSLHDWADWADAHIARRERDADRKRTARRVRAESMGERERDIDIEKKKEAPASREALSARLVAAFREQRDCDYVFAGGRDGKALSQLDALGCPDEVERRWRKALSLGTRWPGCATLHGLVARWNELAGGSATSPGLRDGMAVPSKAAEFDEEAPF